MASLDAIPQNWQHIQIDQAEWSHATNSLKHKFSVIIDEGCRLKVAKMLFGMKDTDPHAILCGRNCLVAILFGGCGILETNKSACWQ